MAHTSEYEIEDIFIDRLEGIGYKFIKLNNYDEVLANFREQLAKFNAKKLEEKGHTASFSDSEFNRIMIHVDNHSVYESAKVLRDKYDLQLDNGESVYIEFFSGDTDRNIYQVTHQVTMDKAHKDDVVYKNRYDVTVLINGLPLVQIELKRPGVEINEAINQINRYRKFSFKGIFRYLQLFVVSNSVQTKYFCNENEMLDGQYNPILKSLVFFWTDEKNTRINDLNTFTGEFFRKSAITEMLNKYMVIKTTEPVLMVMRPYQIYAVKAAKKRVLEVNQNGYVFACTGSGKTLTSFKSWYLYYKDQTHNPNPRVSVPVDVDFDIELVRTDRINVVYILNLLKNANNYNKTEEEKQQDVDLILREIERSDNESLRLKKEVMKQFILTRFYDLPEGADVMEAFMQFEKEQMQADMEEFAFGNEIDYMIVSELFNEYAFHGTISNDDIRKRLTEYKLNILKMTKLTKSVKTFIEDMYNKYKAEGE